MEQRRLGRTEHRSSVAVLGAAAFARCTLGEAEAGFELALSRGVNHVDIAPTYGYAEVVVGAHIAAGAGPAVRRRQERSLQPRRCPRPPGADAQPPRHRPPGPLPAPRRDEPRRPRAALGGRRGRPRRPRRGAHPLRRHHRSRSRHAPCPARGAAPLRPRHRDVPDLPAGVGRSRLPHGRRGAPGRVRRSATSASWSSRRRPAGRGATAIPTRSTLVRAADRSRRHRPRHRLRALHRRGPRVLHPGRPRPAADGARRRGGQPARSTTPPATTPWRRPRTRSSSSRCRTSSAVAEGRRPAPTVRGAASSRLRRRRRRPRPGPRCPRTRSGPG